MRSWWLGCALMVALAGGAGAGEFVHGNPDARQGGVRREHFPVQPATLHPLNATDLYGNRVLDLVYETLAATDIETLEHVPLLAERWEVAPDKMSFTFHLDPRATWQDGRPVTAGDVTFSFEVMFHKQLKTRPKWMSYYSNFEKVEAVGPRAVRFVVKRDHFLNFVRAAGLRIVPRHGFPEDDPNRTPLAKQPMGSGPYAFKDWRKGSLVRMTRHKGYWGGALPQNLGQYNQSQLITKIIAQDKVALETFKKGELDVLTLTPDQWVRESSGEEWGLGAESRRRLVKLEVRNQAPRGYRYVGYNLESPLFADKRVRRAMSHLFDRETFIEKFFHGLQVPAVGPFEANSRYASPHVRPIPFSIPAAIALLREAGWADTDGDNLLDKDGRPFRFTIMTADPETSLKMLTLTKEAMRKAGVDLHIKVVDWTSFLQLIDELKFDAVMLGWSRGVFPDPTALWHSASAHKGGLNFVRFRNAEVDGLIEAAVKSIPEAERVALYRRIHEIIFEEQPYTFLLERDRTLLAYNSRFDTVRPWYAYDVGVNYWWIARPSL